ncbi:MULTISPECIES: OmpA family protein [unclassified Roseitalea]|uniref:OmpA family protein n=1 Tax=unclassified Roseitalea TaxID=2639107 RepID=UPI00273DB6A0|nr:MULTISPECIES: OmpA family protein [unclassified Roseitalea]
MTRRLLETTTAISLLAIVAGAGPAHAQEPGATGDGQASALVQCVIEQRPCPPASDAEIGAAAQILAERTGATPQQAETQLRAAIAANAETEQPMAEEGEREGEPQAATEAEPEAEPQAETEAEAQAAPETTPEQPEEAMEAAEDAQEEAAEAVEDALPEGEPEAEAEAEPEAEAEAEPEAEAPEEADGPTDALDEAMEAARQGESADEDAEVAPEDTAAETPAEAGDETPAEPATEERPQRELTERERVERAQRRAETIAERLRSEALADAEEQLEADLDAEAPAQADVEVETVTEQAARASDEEVADDAVVEQDTQALLRDILGVAAGVAIGSVLGQDTQIVERVGDRVVVERNGELVVLRDDNELLRRPGARVRTRTFADGSTRTVIVRDNDVRIVTIRAADGTILYRARVAPDGDRVVLIDERRADIEPVDVRELPQPRRERVIEYRQAQPETIRRALTAEAQQLERRYSLQQVREVEQLRALMPRIDIAINFAFDSAAIPPNEARALTALGETMAAMIEADPDELFLVEGHTDTVGPAAYNLALSDRRAESVALALTEYFGVPPENMITQGYGERYLKVEEAGRIRANRRAVVRRITPLIQSAPAR